MQSPSLDFPTRNKGIYVTARQLGDYIQHYADFHQVSTLPCHFHSRVSRVEPLTPGSDKTRWSVEWTTVQDGESNDGETRREEFDTVAVATGHYNKAYRPQIPGQEAWLGGAEHRIIVHSQDYDMASEFKRKVVMVVGARSSGADVSRELQGEASGIYTCIYIYEHIYHNIRIRNSDSPCLGGEFCLPS